MPVPVAPEPVAESSPPVTNAAVFYWQAFKLYGALTPSEKKVLVNWRASVDSTVAAELCEKIRPICDQMHQASMLTNCDWDLGPVFEDMQFEHMPLCRGIAQIAVWRAAQCHAGDSAQVFQDLADALRVGQHVSQLRESYAQNIEIQGWVIQFTSSNAARLSNTGRESLAKLFGDARFDNELSHVLGEEAQMLNTKADRFASMPDAEEVRDYLDGLAAMYPQLKRFGPAEAIAGIREEATFVKEYAKMLASTEAEYQAWLAGVADRRAKSPFIDKCWPAMEEMLLWDRAMTVKRAMTVAGLAVVQGGAVALKSYPDPSSGKPYTYTQTGDGFELQSEFQVNGEPLKLQFK